MTTSFDTPLDAPMSLRSRLRARWVRRARAPRVTAPLAPPLLAAPDTGRVRVGAAQVIGVDEAGRPVVRLDDGLLTEVVAEWALPYRYVPAPGDLLWTIGRGPRHWVVSVLHGRGRAELAFRGDVALTAGRRLRLVADRGLRLVGRTVSLRARTLEVVVGALEEKLGDAMRQVRGLLEEVAGSVLRVTDEEECVTAGGDVVILAEDSVRLDGDVLMVS